MLSFFLYSAFFRSDCQSPRPSNNLVFGDSNQNWAESHCVGVCGICILSFIPYLLINWIITLQSDQQHLVKLIVIYCHVNSVSVVISAYFWSFEPDHKMVLTRSRMGTVESAPQRPKTTSAGSFIYPPDSATVLIYDKYQLNK